MTQYRDLTIIPLDGKEELVIACDSSAAIGEKKGDCVKTSPAITAAFCLRVPLLEVLAIGAQPIAVIDVIGNEYDTTGKKMLEGIKEELTRAGLSNLPINGSTEENMPTVMSSLGITVIGKVLANQKRIGCLKAGDAVYYVGQPFVGKEVVAHRDMIFSYAELANLLEVPGILEILPVGSKGILHEAEELAKSSQLTFELAEEQSDTLELKKSAGPATVLVIGVSSTKQEQIEQLELGLKFIGYVKEER